MSALAHFADSSRTSPEVRDVPISDTGPAIPSLRRSGRASAVSPNGTLWNIRSGIPSLVRLDPCELHHLAPFLGFVGNKLSELGRRARKHRSAQLGKPRPHIRIGEARIDFLVELVDDISRRTPWRAHAVPGAHLITRHEIAHGRQVWQHLRARSCGYCERADFAGPDVPDRVGHKVEIDVDLSGE